MHYRSRPASLLRPILLLLLLSVISRYRPSLRNVSLCVHAYYNPSSNGSGAGGHADDDDDGGGGGHDDAVANLLHDDHHHHGPVNNNNHHNHKNHFDNHNNNHINHNDLEDKKLLDDANRSNAGANYDQMNDGDAHEDHRIGVNGGINGVISDESYGMIGAKQQLMITRRLINQRQTRVAERAADQDRKRRLIQQRREERERDRIGRLPGQPRVEFEQFSGYVNVNTRDGRALFYWLTQSPTDPSSKPLLLWLNGGPGCSSVAYGASEEIGPFRIKKNGAGLYLNQHSWNKVANILFLESPAGVGFSYTNTTSNLLDTGDIRTAEDAYVFLVNWIERFPEYKGRDFYIAGESYAGHYVPQLAKLVYERINRKTLQRRQRRKTAGGDQQPPAINLKGFLVGNAVTDNELDNIGTVDFWWSHAIISDSLHRGILENCNFSGAGGGSSSPSSSDGDGDDDDDDGGSSAAAAADPACARMLDAVNRQSGHIDPYNIYMSSCSDPLGHRRRHRRSSSPQHFKYSLLERVRGGYDPCIENNAEIYFNRADVQRALHANVTSIPYRWTACSSTLIRNWNDSSASILPIYRELIGTGLRIWVFSGDVDSVVPVTATRYSLAQLRLNVTTAWYPWYHKNEVGGWTEVYDGLTFATVRGAGHEVPLFQPQRAFTLVRSFLSGRPLPIGP